MDDYPASIVPVNHVAPVPRRIRAYLGAEKVLDTTRALYVWEWPHYPQYYIPLDDVRRDVLVSEGHTQRTGRGLAELHGLEAGQAHRPRAARVITDSAIEGLKGTVRFEWAALDAWFEEDEQVFVHPRDPYTRVDALRSNRRVRVELDGIVLADSASPVMVFETGLPVRYYVNRTDVRFEHLVPSDTVTSCPYKGMTSGYWSVRVGGSDAQGPGLAYDFPTRQLLPITDLVTYSYFIFDSLLSLYFLLSSIVPVNHVAPVPRRLRAYLAAEKVLDTTRALYVWEWPHYPQYYIPLDDVRRDVLVSEGHTQRTGRGLAELHGLEPARHTGRGRPG